MAVLLLVAFLALAFAHPPESTDYLVIGGGTAGLTIATRLSEDPGTTVTVLEAGEDRSQDVAVLAPGLLTSLYGDAKYDWNYHTTPQKHANNHVLAHPRGKQLGGSSAINFIWWTHASQTDINNWGKLGNSNWSWDALDPFFCKSEAYQRPAPSTQKALQTQYIQTGLHGQNGPILNGFPDIHGIFDEAWPRTYETLGLAVQSDPRDGKALGGYTNLINIDVKTRSRSYAATTYLQEALKRPNFHVVTGAHVEKILLETKGDIIRATGAIYKVNGTKYMVKTQRETILSAGAFGSPQLLELSGIGNPKILRKHGIKTIVDNPNVGENLQDHAYTPLGFKVREPGIFTLDDFANETLFDEAYEQYTTNRTGVLATTTGMSALLSLKQIRTKDFDDLSIDEAVEKFCKTQDKSHSHELRSLPDDQLALLCNDIWSEAVVQEFANPGGISPQLSNDSSKLFLANAPGNFFSLQGVLEHPFSRGSVHIKSANASEYPRIDPRYLSHPLDLKILSAIALHLQEVATTKPLSDLLVDNGTLFQPGYHKLHPGNVEAWIKDNLQSEYHPCGTCAMLPRSSGGVVDERFRVHGVKSLRVVDASVFPLIPRANLQTLVYAVAERAADFVKEGKVTV